VAKLQFLGATGTVTGSKYLLEHGEHEALDELRLLSPNRRFSSSFS
jgi:hypothetical protein